jgi:hypothetical protein
MKEINCMLDREACIEEVVKMTYIMGIPDDSRFKILTLVQLPNDELARRRLDCYVELINYAYKRLGSLSI